MENIREIGLLSMIQNQSKNLDQLKKGLTFILSHTGTNCLQILIHGAIGKKLVRSLTRKTVFCFLLRRTTKEKRKLSQPKPSRSFENTKLISK